MKKDSYGIRTRFLEAIEYIKATKDEAYRQISLAISTNEYYVSKVRNDNQGVTHESLSILERKYGISQEWVAYNKGKMLIEAKSVNEMNVVRDENLEAENERLKKEKESLLQKLVQQHEKFQALQEEYNKNKEELDLLKSKQKQG